jgi:hypothetical protein
MSTTFVRAASVTLMVGGARWLLQGLVVELVWRCARWENFRRANSRNFRSPETSPDPTQGEQHHHNRLNYEAIEFPR